VGTRSDPCLQAGPSVHINVRQANRIVKEDSKLPEILKPASRSSSWELQREIRPLPSAFATAVADWELHTQQGETDIKGGAGASRAGGEGTGGVRRHPADMHYIPSYNLSSSPRAISASFACT
jgi:hypothetical protein